MNVARNVPIDGFGVDHMWNSPNDKVSGQLAYSKNPTPPLCH